MTVNDSLNYVLFGNPLSHGIISAVSSIAKSTGMTSSKPGTNVAAKTTKIVSNALPLWRLAGRNLNFVRLAGVSGASAVILGAYGSHRKYPDDKGESRKIFETANTFHFFHTIALVAVPLTRRPIITGSLMILGSLLFCGACYYRAFTGDRKYGKLAPVGGSCLILAWLSMIL